MKLIWSANARADATQIQRYIGRDSVRAAAEMRGRIAQAGKQLLDQPTWVAKVASGARVS